ncbi:hypothetical protein D3C76_1718580 [compost metagenome]
MRSKLFQGEQRAIHARRGHFKGIFGSDRVFDIEDRAGLVTDFCAVINKHAIFFIDINPQDRMFALRDEFDPPALIAKSLDHRGQQGLQLF